MPSVGQLIGRVDRRLVGLIRAHVRRRSPVVKFLPDRWLTPLLASSARWLHTKLMTGLAVLSILILGAAFWLALS